MADTAEKMEDHVEIYTALEDSVTDPTGSGLKDTISGSKELRDDDLDRETSSKMPKSIPDTLSPTT